MQVAPLARHVKASDLPPERLAANPRLSEQEKVAEGSRQFEALLLRQILSEAQKPVLKSSLTPDSTAAGIYRDLITQQLADSISKSGSFGLAQTLNSQLNRQLRPHASQAKPDGPTASAAPARGDRPEHGAQLLMAKPAAGHRHAAATEAAPTGGGSATPPRPVGKTLRNRAAPEFAKPANRLLEHGAEALRASKPARPATPPPFHRPARHHE